MQFDFFFRSQYHSLPHLHFSGKYANEARVWLDGGHAVITNRKEILRMQLAVLPMQWCM